MRDLEVGASGDLGGGLASGRVAIEVRRDDLSQARIVRSVVPDPGDGQVLLEIERFALSANNITYARLGDRIGYWRFFPAAPGWGCVPVWGIARVIDSRRTEMPVGRIASGLFPMASHVLMSPGRVGRGGFDENSDHRRDLPRLYNVYRWTTGGGHEQDLRLVLQPSFWLSFLLADFLAAQNFFEAGLVVLSSASSKSALGLAFLLQCSHVRTVGLTSDSRTEEVGGLGLYDRVLSYDAIGTLGSEPEPTVFIDLAGSPAIRDAVHTHVGSRLRHSALAGTTHGQADPHALAPGPAPQPFFVPDYLRARAGQTGMEVIAARFDDALAEFGRSSESWLRLEYVQGPDRVLAAYHRTLAGDVPVSAALICSMQYVS
jgi:hypothetical protein